MEKDQLEVFIALKWVKIWTEDLKERGKTKSEIDHNKSLIEFKRDTRRKLKRFFEDTPEESGHYRIWKADDEYDSFTDVYLIPRTESETREDFEDWFWECRARSIRGYDYSPTGLLFTQSVRFAKQTLSDGRPVWRVHETLTRDV